LRQLVQVWCVLTNSQENAWTNGKFNFASNFGTNITCNTDNNCFNAYCETTGLWGLRVIWLAKQLRKNLCIVQFMSYTWWHGVGSRVHRSVWRLVLGTRREVSGSRRRGSRNPGRVRTRIADQLYDEHLETLKTEGLLP
jgi:hypothetical protein